MRVCKYCGVVTKQLLSHVRENHPSTYDDNLGVGAYAAKRLDYPGVSEVICSARSGVKFDIAQLKNDQIVAIFTRECRTRPYVIENLYARYANLVSHLRNLKIPTIFVGSDDSVRYTSAITRYDQSVSVPDNKSITQRDSLYRGRAQSFSQALDIDDRVVWYSGTSMDLNSHDADFVVSRGSDFEYVKVTGVSTDDLTISLDKSFIDVKTGKKYFYFM